MKRKTAKANVKTKTRLLSLLLAVLMTFFCFPVTALGGGESDSESASVVPDAEQNSAGTASDEEFFGEEEEFIPWELELEEGDLDLLTLKTAELDPSEKPEIISASLIEEKQHVNRLYEQEPDVFTIMFQNRDGGKTVYVFSHPVKTVSPSGVYTDMTAAQIQAAVNSTAASTNATGIASSSLSLTASGSKMQIALGSDFIKSRLGNLDAEKPIMSYNIGEFVIFKARASTLTNGISDITYDVTDEAREWATPGSEVPKFTFVPEISDTQIEADDNVSLGGSVGIITPTVEEEIVVMSLAYSLAAGQYSMKSISDGKFLFATTTERILTGSTLYVPDGKWHFQYLSNGKYYIKPLTRQNMFLSCYEDSLCLLPQADNEDEPQPTMWTLNLQSNSTGYIHTSDSMYISSGLNMVPGVEENISMWQLGNHDDAELVRSITISNIMISPGESVDVPVIAKSPDVTAYTSSDEYFEWVSLDSENIGYNIDDGFYVNETYGVYRIYCRYKFNPTIISNTAVIIISDDYDITSGAVYLIRPYQTTIDSSTKLLTMSVGSNSNSLSLSGWETDWHDSSQAFTITQVGDKYRISAIMSTSQYNGGTTYINKHTMSNTLYVTSNRTLGLKRSDSGSTTGVPNNNDLSQLWYIKDVGSSVIFVSAYDFQYILSYDNLTNGVHTLASNISSANTLWDISQFGVDAPSIKQRNGYCCGATATLQVLYGCGYYTSGNWDSQQQNIVSIFAGPPYNDTNSSQDAIGARTLRNYLGNTVPPASSGATYRLITKNTFTDMYDFENYLTPGLLQGYPAILNAGSDIICSLPYYGPNYEYSDSGHYICVFGYDEKTQTVALSDCHFSNEYFGIHLVSLNEAYAALANWIFCQDRFSS